MEHRGVSAAEKYAELEKAGALRPRCSCHGEEMGWALSREYLAGGRWACAVRTRERAERWRKTHLDLARKRSRDSARRARTANPQKFLERERQWRRENPERIAANNAARLMAGGMYLGRCGFNQTEVEAILSGTSE